MFELAQYGQDLIKFIPDAAGAIKVYEFGKQQYDSIRGFIGKKQIENIAQLSANAAEKLKDVPPERLSEPSPSVLTPLIEGAMQESRSELQERWATLLANSMIDGGIRVRQGFSQVLSKFDPPDVLVLSAIIKLPQPQGWNLATLSTTNRTYIEQQLLELRLSRDEWETSCQNLRQLGCTGEAPNFTESTFINSRPFATSFGKKLLEACTLL